VYRYYEFRALDRPLSSKEMAEVRQLSTRALITPTVFRNEYNWGDFRGDPFDLMVRYYDAHLFYTDGGDRQLMLRLPKAALDPAVVEPFLVWDYLELHPAGDNVILAFIVENDEGDGWGYDAEEEGENWLANLVSQRSELASGDLRALYLGWLASVWDEGDEDSEEMQRLEPPVPPGLGELSCSLSALADLLVLDQYLVKAAAEASVPLLQPSSADFEEWVLALPQPEKDSLLVRLLRDGSPLARAELFQRWRAERGEATAQAPTRRTVAQLLARADELEETEQRQEEAEKAALRAAYLMDLSTREGEAWEEVEALIEKGHSSAYDRAASTLRDLQDLAVLQGRKQLFRDRIEDLRTRYARRQAFLRRLDEVLSAG
jgi:hypothetical protein